MAEGDVFRDEAARYCEIGRTCSKSRGLSNPASKPACNENAIGAGNSAGTNGRPCTLSLQILGDG